MYQRLAYALLLIVAVISGCAGRGVIGGSHVPGFLYGDTSLPVSAAAGAQSVKEGRACASSVLGWVAYGDASINAAMAAGGITEVAFVDVQIENTLNVYAKYCTIVRGK